MSGPVNRIWSNDQEFTHNHSGSTVPLLPSTLYGRSTQNLGPVFCTQMRQSNNSSAHDLDQTDSIWLIGGEAQLLILSHNYDIF